MLDPVLDKLAADDADAIERLKKWLAIPSVSTDPAYRDDVRRAAAWVVEQLGEAGIAAELRETGTPASHGHPIVWAEHDPARAEGPHVLFYGHYDVQPPDPLELWESPPFEPVVKPAEPGPAGEVPGERIVARGAVDDKGQVASFLEALRAWHAVHGEIPVRMTILIEGEEESGSVNLERFVRDHRSELERCDICVISDTGMLARGEPAITYGVRGLAYAHVELHGPDQDLHSGMWGGRCPNPVSELVRVLAQLWDADRRVTIPGFYDTVRPIEDAERDAWRNLPLDYPGMLRKIGLGPDADVGEAGYTAMEREWGRPACDVNGIFGGYAGEGAKTVIPAWAGAKVSFRLVADQQPGPIFDAFRGWLEERTPPGCRWVIRDLGGGAPGTVASDSPYLQAAARALARAGGTTPHLIKTGGSIPVVGLLKSELGLDTLLVGFGLDDDRVHSPNEKFELDCLRLGMRTHAALLDEWRGMLARG